MALPARGDPAAWIILGVIAGLVLAAAGIGYWLHQRRRRRDIDRRLRDASRDLLADFLIPDGNAGQIQVQYALLTSRGIVVLDIKDVDGHVFGSEAMQDWTVIAKGRRYTFTNPQSGLWDRVAAIKRITPEVPVTGTVAFTSRARFSKGQPRSVSMLEVLLRELERDAAAERSGSAEGFLPYWERLRETAMNARMENLLNVGRR